MSVSRHHYCDIGRNVGHGKPYNIKIYLLLGVCRPASTHMATPLCDGGAALQKSSLTELEARRQTVF